MLEAGQGAVARSSSTSIWAGVSVIPSIHEHVSPVKPEGVLCLKVKGKSLSRVRLFATPWTVAYQAAQSMEFSRQEGTFLTQGLNPGLPHCRRILYHLSHQGSPVTYKGTSRILSADFSAEILQVRRDWQAIFKVLRERERKKKKTTLLPSILYLAKLSFRAE